MGSSALTYYDLREEARAGRLPDPIGRIGEMERLDRIVGRRVNGNALIVGPAGSGKTALAYGWMRRMSACAQHEPLALLQLDSEHIRALDDASVRERCEEALAHVPPGVLFVDDFGRETYKHPAIAQGAWRIYRHMLQEQAVHVVFALEPHEHAWLEREYPAFVSLFETILLGQPEAADQERMLVRALPRLNARHRRIVPDASLREIVRCAQRYPALGHPPLSSIRLLDEAIVLAASRGHTIVTPKIVATAVEGRIGVPAAHLGGEDLRNLKRLEEDLNARVVGQESAIASIASTLRRARLGLRDEKRPLGSFLMLGPSGCGKTETAKCVAEALFGGEGSFVRFDMSEFQQEHAAQRLIGAPAGYIGYEEGGALTNALKKNPYSLILLDEIEKAHPKVFDLFLQVLDEGRITSGHNETADARQCIVMATSNCGVDEILRSHAQGADDELLLRERIMPALARAFRLEFINRFDAIVIFRPLPAAALMRIARLEIGKIEKRLAAHRVRFDIEPAVVEERICALADPRFGARPVKRFIEETCETLVAQSLFGVHA